MREAEGQLLWAPAPSKSQEGESVVTGKSDSPAPIPVWSRQWFFLESSFESYTTPRVRAGNGSALASKEKRDKGEGIGVTSSTAPAQLDLKEA